MRCILLAVASPTFFIPWLYSPRFLYLSREPAGRFIAYQLPSKTVILQWPRKNGEKTPYQNGKNDANKNVWSSQSSPVDYFVGSDGVLLTWKYQPRCCKAPFGWLVQTHKLWNPYSTKQLTRLESRRKTLKTTTKPSKMTEATPKHADYAYWCSSLGRNALQVVNFQYLRPNRQRVLTKQRQKFYTDPRHRLDSKHAS